MKFNKSTDLPNDVDTVEKNLIWSASVLADEYDTVQFEEVRGQYELAMAENVFPVIISGSQNPSNYLWIVRGVVPIDNAYRQRHFTYQNALPLGDVNDVVPLAFKGS